MRLLAFLFILVLASCTTKETKTLQSKGNLCKYAKHLQLFQTEKGIEVIIQHPDFKDKKYHFLIVDDANTQVDKATKIVQGEKLAVLSATHIGMLSALGMEEKITAVSNAKYIYSPKLKSRIKEGKTISLGDEGQLSIEKILKSKSKIIVYSAFSSELSQEEQLKRLQIYCIPDFDWRENTPLGRAEWLLLFAALEGKLDKGLMLFQSIKKNYLESTQLLKNPKKVLVGNVTGEFWYAPAGESYMAYLLKDAGMDYVFASTKGTGSLSLNMEEVLQSSKKVDIWLNPGFPSRKAIITANPKAQFLSVFSKGQIYCYTHDSNKFWELSAVHPDWLLADFRALAIGNKQKMYFYKAVK